MGWLTFVIFVFFFLVINSALVFFRDKKLLLFSPLYFFSLSWCISMFLYLLGEDFLREKTAYSLIIFYLSFCIPSLLVLLNASRSSTLASTATLLIHVTKKYKKIVGALLFLQLVSIFAALGHIYYAMQFSGACVGCLIDQPENMPLLRGVLATQDYGIPIWLKLLNQMKYTNYFAPLVIVSLTLLGSVHYKYVIASLFLAILYFVFYLERSGIIRIVILFCIFYSFNYVETFKRSLRIVIPVLVLLTAVTLSIPLLRGQFDEGGTNLYDYVVGGLSGLDAFIAGYNGSVAILENQEIYVSRIGYNFGDAPIGFETMTELYRVCNSFFGCSFEIANGKEYIDYPIKTNIYTALRAFYQDFGFIGVPIVVSFLGLITSVIYLHFARRGGIWSGYMIAYMGYVSVLSILTYNFLFRDVAVVFILMFLLSFVFRTGSLFWGNKKMNIHIQKVPLG